MAITHFFGIADLHYENILHNEIDGRLCLFPIDLESVFDPLGILSQSYLLKSFSNDNKVTGVSQLPKHVISAPIVIDCYLRSMNLFNSLCEPINLLISEQDIEKIPIRRIIKSTEVYAKSLEQDENDWTEFYKEEVEQLRRADIPYFYSYPHQNKLYYLSENGEKEASISWDEAYPIKVEKYPKKPQVVLPIKDEQLKISTLQLARNFFNPKKPIEATSTTDVRHDDTHLFVMTQNQWRLRCKKPSF